MTVTGDDALVGRVLDGRYQIGTRIARGGMASVFRAHDERLDREVALKVMHHSLGDDQQFTGRFEREAKAAAKLNHRNVVSVFDQGVDGDLTYLVMEFVPGRTLRDVMRDEAPMAPIRALQLVEQVLIALSAAHAAKIIHRDVKPENVLITPDGEVKVADFGLARAVSAATTATGGTLIGTVSYLAPEIVLHDGADARSDVYAVGAMIYEMLTGVKPHVGDTPIQVAYKHVHEDVAAPSELRPELPAYVDALVARSTVRDRDQRSTDARVLLQQVRSVRRALEAGVTDDPDLVNDLLPRPAGDAEPTRPVKKPRVITPFDDELEPTVAVSTGSVPTVSVPVTAAVAAPEPTMSWAGGAPAPPEDLSTVTGLHPPMSPEDYRAMRQSTPRRSRGRLLLVLAILLAIIAAGAGWWYADGRYSDTPTLVGVAETEGKATVEKAGLKFKVGERRYSETEAAGTIMSTNPEAGAKILPGATITAVVSKGKDRVLLPEGLRGKTPAQVKEMLAKVDLVLGKTSSRYAETVDEGLVIGATNVKAGQQLKRGSVVDIRISRGRQPIEVRDYTGQLGTIAQNALEKAGFTVNVVREFSDDVDKADVISQSPNSGTKFKNDTITITVSKGPDVVTVPDVVGRSSDEARAILDKAGFDPVAFPGDYTVNRQSPAAGEKIKRGSRVGIAPF